MEQLADCFNDIANELEKQGQDLKLIETNVESSELRIAVGIEELSEAERLANKVRLRKCIIITIIIAVIACVISFSFLGNGKMLPLNLNGTYRKGIWKM